MEVISTDIPDVKIITPDVFRDPRGYFCETYNEARYVSAGITAKFVQDNESCSSRGVLRGLHWQAAPHTQAKLVRVIRGAVWDVAVDIRKGSPTFGRHVSCVLCSDDSAYLREHAADKTLVPFRQFYIPRGFAHGFVGLEDNTLFSYKCDNLYCHASECGMRFDDPELDIAWPNPAGGHLLSDKDLKHPFLKDIEPWAEI